MDRFLRYSLEHKRAVRMILLGADGKFRQVNAVVERYDEKTADLYILRPISRQTVAREEILSVDYARGDEGQD